MIGIMILITAFMIMAMFMIKMTLMTLTMIVTLEKSRGLSTPPGCARRLPADNWQAVICPFHCSENTTKTNSNCKMTVTSRDARGSLPKESPIRVEEQSNDFLLLL